MFIQKGLRFTQRSFCRFTEIFRRLEIHVDLADQGVEPFFLQLPEEDIRGRTMDRREDAGMERSVADHIADVGIIDGLRVFRISEAGFLREGVGVEPVAEQKVHPDPALVKL